MTPRSASAALAAASSLFACALHGALAAAPALAAPAPDSERAPLDLGEETGRASASGGGSLVRTLVGLAVVIGVIYGLHWVLKQVKASRDERSTGEGLATLATLPLGSGRSLHVVRAGTEVVVLGVAEHGVVPIRTYTEEEARAAGLVPGDDREPAKAAAAPAAAVKARAALATLRAWTVRA
jgi:flagellar protein FliO/FliZ